MKYYALTFVVFIFLAVAYTNEDDWADHSELNPTERIAEHVYTAAGLVTSVGFGSTPNSHKAKILIFTFSLVILFLSVKKFNN